MIRTRVIQIFCGECLNETSTLLSILGVSSNPKKDASITPKPISSIDDTKHKKPDIKSDSNGSKPLLVKVNDYSWSAGSYI